VKLSGPMIAVVAAVLFGIGLVFMDIGSKSVGPFKLLAYSQIIGAVLIYIFTKITKKKMKIKKLFSLYKKEVFEIFVFRSIIGQMAMLYGFFLTTAIKGSFFTRFESIFVVIMGFIFLGERINKKEIFAILMVTVGAILLATNGNFTNFTSVNTGDILIVLSVLAFSYTFISGRKIKEVSPITTTFVTSLIGGIAVLLLLPILGESIMINTINDVLIIGGFSIVFTSGMLLFYDSLTKAKAWIVGAILSIQTVVAALIAFLFLEQTLMPIQLIGAIVVLAMSIFITYQSHLSHKEDLK
jgi:drug/metabolite transporter (DMT)-like permease